MLMPFGNIQSSHATLKNQISAQKSFNYYTSRCLISCNIYVTNKSIQKGNIRITSTYVDDPLLQDSASFSYTDVAFQWERVWGEQLRKQFPNDFSLLGVIDIRKLINALSQSEKKGTRYKVQNYGEDNIIVLGNASNSESEKWKSILKRVVADDHTLKPECIYKAFVNEIEKEGINTERISNKKQMKVKIGTLERSEKRRMQRFLV